jgi:dihydroflavonol-4-reductase
MATKYLVTGADGYIAMHVVDQLLKQGHSVRGTTLSLNDKDKVEALKKLGPIELVEAELLDADSWKKAVKGIDVVLHIASPLPLNQAIDENLIIKPAVEGIKINTFN